MLSRRGITDGVLFFTYSLLVSNRQTGAGNVDQEEPVEGEGPRTRCKSDFLINPRWYCSAQYSL
eukprot:scaffold648795_cov47-Prasinocladus_malaysianus.AAC.1